MLAVLLRCAVAVVAVVACVTIGSGLAALPFADDTCASAFGWDVGPPAEIGVWPYAVACETNAGIVGDPVGPPVALIVALSLAVAAVSGAVALRPTSGWPRSYAQLVATLGVFGLLALAHDVQTALVMTTVLGVLLGAVLQLALPRHALDIADDVPWFRKIAAGAAIALTLLLLLPVLDGTPWPAALLIVGLQAAAAATTIRALRAASLAVLGLAGLRLGASTAVAMTLCVFAYDSGAAYLAAVAAVGIAAAIHAVTTEAGT